MSDTANDGAVRRTCITVDLENYSKLDGPTQRAAQLGLAEALDAAAAEVGLQRLTWQRQQGGDGELAVLPLGENEPLAVGAFPVALDNRFRMLHQREGLLLRARMAINHGMVAPAAMGYSGWGPCDVARIVDAPAVREALKKIHEARIVLALSAEIFHDLVEQGHTTVRPEQFRQVPVPRIDATAWVMIPQVDPDLIPVDAQDEEPDQRPAAPVQQQAEARNSTVVQSGRDTSGNVIGSNNTVTTSNIHSPVNADTLHIGPRHG